MKKIFPLISIWSTLSCFAQTESRIDYVKENTYYFEINESNIEGKGKWTNIMEAY